MTETDKLSPEAYSYRAAQVKLDAERDYWFHCENRFEYAETRAGAIGVRELGGDTEEFGDEGGLCD
jgi:hypothetical protein